MKKVKSRFGRNTKSAITSVAFAFFIFLNACPQTSAGFDGGYNNRTYVQALHNGQLVTIGVALFLLVITIWRFIRDSEQGFFIEDGDFDERF